MKQLRILTGRHAGAQLALTQPQYRLGAGGDADILVSDWTADPLLLQVDGDHGVTATAGGTAAAAARTLADFEPCRFGDVVLCTGPHDAAWPADMQLLERLMRPPVPAAAVRRAGPSGVLAATGVVATLTVAGLFLFLVSHQADAARDRMPPEPLGDQVLRAVRSSTRADVAVLPQGERVVVEGLLDSSADVAAMRQLLARFPGEYIEHRYAAANEVAQSIDDALASPDLAVAYRGRGVFEVTGRTQQPDQVRRAASRIAADLAPLVRGIEVVAAEVQPPDRVPVDAMLSGHGLQYVQTRDGAKHLSILPGPIVELIDPPRRPSH
jgi:type III secretion protein D